MILVIFNFLKIPPGCCSMKIENFLRGLSDEILVKSLLLDRLLVICILRSHIHQFLASHCELVSIKGDHPCFIKIMNLEHFIVFSKDVNLQFPRFPGSWVFAWLYIYFVSLIWEFPNRFHRTLRICIRQTVDVISEGWWSTKKVFVDFMVGRLSKSF